MTHIVDTTIRLLSQEPLAGKVPNGEILRIAEILDGAGLSCLEVSGGGVFDAMVRRGVESPWERIRAIDARTTTPLGIALRGRFLVGNRPAATDIVERFVACAAENGIDVFRLHDPLNDVSNLREAGEAIAGAGRTFHAELGYTPGRPDELDAIVEQARKLPDIGARRVVISDPAGALLPHLTEELVGRLRDATDLPVGFSAQSSSGTGLASALVAARAGADLVSAAVYPVALSLHRVPGESLAAALAGLGLDSTVVTDRLWAASDVIDEHIGDEPIVPVPPRIAVRAAEHDLPTALVAALDLHLRAHSAADRLLDALAEVVALRADAGWPPLAPPIGQILASQALLNVLSARRYGTVLDEFRLLVVGAYGAPPAPIAASVIAAVGASAPAGAALDDDPPSAEDVREAAAGLAASEEDLVLLAMFGADAESLLRTIRQRHSREASLLEGDAESARNERIRELVRIVQESGVGEIEIEDEGMRVSVRRADEVQVVVPAPVTSPATEERVTPANGYERIESPMVATFYRASSPGAPPFVEVGDRIEEGQTLCILEAMKLMNEVKAEAAGIVRAIHVGNAEPVEYGQLLFELEPV